MKTIGTFPFGQPVQEIKQEEKTPKDIFILGVYASAVHARWINTTGKNIVNALAVASEPYIFWRGDNAESIVQKIVIPQNLGKLIPARQDFNGPSGLALDELILTPLELNRQNVWLCDLVPHSCVNLSQMKAIQRAYLPVMQEYGLAEHTVPSVPTRLTDESRRKAILDEILISKAKILILLGDQPIKWFLHYFDRRWSNLSDFTKNSQTYGQLHDVEILNKSIKVLPLAHPRQIAKLGQFSKAWYETHQQWLKVTSSHIAQAIKAG